MSEQQHKIKRQLIELHNTPNQAEARQLQSEISRIFHRRIVPLIDQYCTELSSPDRIHRIDSLEIDLGQISPANLEAEIVTKFRIKMRQALASQIEQQEATQSAHQQNPKSQSQLELFAQFARTGSIPWWADATQTQLLSDCLQYLLTTSPQAVRAFMVQILAEKRPLQRLINHFNVQEILALLNLFRPSHDPINQQFVLILQQNPSTKQKGRFADQQMLWETLFEVVLAHQNQTTTNEQIYTAVCKRIAPKLHITYANLLLNLHQQIHANKEIHTNKQKAEIRTLIELLLEEEKINQQTNIAHEQTPDETKETLGENIHEILQHLRAMSPDLQALWRIIEKQIPELSPSLYAKIQLYLAQFLKEQTTSTVPSSTDELAKTRAIQQIFYLLQLTPKQLQTYASPASEMSDAHRKPLIEMATQIFEQQQPPQEEAFTAQLTFTDPEEIYIKNAGLVILWPFLSHFFTHLDMLQEKQFKDVQTQQKAVGLLQYLATAETDFPEFLLPLNKILCGVDLLDVFKMDEPISDVEKEEVDNLLTAVITQAPILRNMSIAGFRQTFLLREGVLRARDGAWLLQVEHLTHDIVLDRFPWSWGWVKLPWMEIALRVEW